MTAYRDAKPDNTYDTYVDEEGEPTLPSRRCPENEPLPVVPMWRVVIGLLLLEAAP